MNEYDSPVSTYYDLLTAGFNDIPFYVEEALKSGSPVLELGCGTGRVASAIAAAGVHVVGLDCSETMLRIGRNNMRKLEKDAAALIDLLHGDMRDFDLGASFRLVVIPCRSFQYLLTPEDQRRALQCVRRHLTPDGRLVFNIGSPRAGADSYGSAPRAGAMRKSDELTVPESNERLIVWQAERIDQETQVVEYDLVFELFDAEGRMVSRHHVLSRLRYTHRFEMQHLLERCGFSVESLLGTFRREPFKFGREQIWTASVDPLWKDHA